MTTETTKPKRKPRPKVKCRHCGHEGGHKRLGKPYPNGNKRYQCASCGRPFIDRRNSAVKPEQKAVPDTNRWPEVVDYRTNECPACKSGKTAVYDTRTVAPGLKERLHRCHDCGITFGSMEDLTPTN